MSLFVCEECRCLENTALSRFHLRGDGSALCSACDPEIGKWHGMFPKRSYDPRKDAPAFIDGEWRSLTDNPHLSAEAKAEAEEALR